jgi:hypothetical protein
VDVGAQIEHRGSKSTNWSQNSFKTGAHLTAPSETQLDNMLKEGMTSENCDES